MKRNHSSLALASPTSQPLQKKPRTEQSAYKATKDDLPGMLVYITKMIENHHSPDLICDKKSAAELTDRWNKFTKKKREKYRTKAGQRPVRKGNNLAIPPGWTSGTKQRKQEKNRWDLMWRGR